MSTENERQPVELTPDQLWAKWAPESATSKARGEYMADLERVILGRIGEGSRETTAAGATQARTLRPAHDAENSDAGGFSWDADQAVVVKRVDPIAVYKNADGDLVVRQETRSGKDAVVIVPARYAYSVIEALQRLLKGPMFAEPPAPDARAGRG
jgi:hypothetical protein